MFVSRREDSGIKCGRRADWVGDGFYGLLEFRFQCVFRVGEFASQIVVRDASQVRVTYSMRAEFDSGCGHLDDLRPGDWATVVEGAMREFGGVAMRPCAENL